MTKGEGTGAVIDLKGLLTRDEDCVRAAVEALVHAALRKVDDDCLQELRWFYDRRDLAEVRRDIAQWLAKWQRKYPRLCNWVEDNVEETLTFYRLPLQHHKRIPRRVGHADTVIAVPRIERTLQILLRGQLAGHQREVASHFHRQITPSLPAPMATQLHDFFTRAMARTAPLFMSPLQML